MMNWIGAIILIVSLLASFFDWSVFQSIAVGLLTFIALHMPTGE